jgi:hypothetical protein
MMLRQVPEIDSPYNKKIINPLDFFSRSQVLDTALSCALMFGFLTHDVLDIYHGGLGYFFFHASSLMSLKWPHFLRDVVRLDKKVTVFERVAYLSLFGQQDFVVRIGPVVLSEFVGLN